MGALLGTLECPDEPVRILGMRFGPDVQLEKNWTEVQSKVDKRMDAWLHRHLSLKGRADVCVTYIYPLILCRLSVFPVTVKKLTIFQQLLPKMLWVIGRLMVCMKVCIQRPRHVGLGLRLAFLGSMIAWNPVWALQLHF